MRRLVLVLVLAVGCKKPSTGDVTRDWFEEHRSSMGHVRDMLRADGLRNIVSAKALPVWDAAKCPTTTTVYYEAIAPDGWYAERCRL